MTREELDRISGALGEVGSTFGQAHQNKKKAESEKSYKNMVNMLYGLPTVENQVQPETLDKIEKARFAGINKDDKTGKITYEGRAAYWKAQQDKREAEEKEALASEKLSKTMASAPKKFNIPFSTPTSVDVRHREFNPEEFHKSEVERKKADLEKIQADKQDAVSRLGKYFKDDQDYLKLDADAAQEGQRNNAVYSDIFGTDKKKGMGEQQYDKFIDEIKRKQAAEAELEKSRKGSGDAFGKARLYLKDADYYLMGLIGDSSKVDKNTFSSYDRSMDMYNAEVPERLRLPKLSYEDYASLTKEQKTNFIQRLRLMMNPEQRS